MAAIIINGMDMPIKNGCTTLTIWPNGTVNAVVYTQGGRSATFSTKTAVPLPDGHGRLIDAYALYMQLHRMYHGAISDSDIKVYEALGMISNAPTIVPAEGGADTDG